MPSEGYATATVHSSYKIFTITGHTTREERTRTRTKTRIRTKTKTRMRIKIRTKRI